jgi:ribosomal protein S18 acetylase RimI-like enzyme
MRLSAMTGREDPHRLLAIAAADMSAEYGELLAGELEGVARGTHRGIVALVGNDPIGYAVYHRTVSTYHLDTIAVEASHRRAGVGSALLAGVCADLQAVRPTILHVVTDALARAAVSFYHAQGFVRAGLVTDEFLPGITQVHLKREIR